MINFLSVSIQNFLSYGNNPTVVLFNSIGTTLIKGENGVGKAQPLTAKIKIPGGWTTMGEIAVGDQVITPAGTTSQVIGLFPQGTQPVYRVTFRDGRSTTASDNHLWEVFSHRWGKAGTRGQKILTTLELKHFVDEANRIKRPIKNIFVPKITHEYLPDSTVPIHPYLLGCLLGDGSFAKSAVVPKLTSTDDEIVSKINQLLAQDDLQLKLFGTNKIDYAVCNIKVRSKGNKLREKLKLLNLWGLYSHEKFVPNEYLEGTSLNQKIGLLNGLLDTDGTADKKGGVSFSSSSYQLALDVQYLVRSIGGEAKISTRIPSFTYNGEKRKGRISYDVRISYKDPQELFTLDRKVVRIAQKPQYADMGLRVTNVEYIGEEPTQCILIDDHHHLYITDEFIVTHNTTIMNAIVYGLYDRAMGNSKVDDLINHINKKNLEVIVTFEKDGKQFTVKRIRKGGKSGRENGVFVEENGRDVTRDSIANANKHIEEIVGMAYSDFIRIVVISAEEEPFLNLPVTSHYQANQTDFIERLFNITMLSEKAETLKKKVSDTEEMIKDEKRSIEQLEQEHMRHQLNVDDVKRRVLDWEKSNNRSIKQLNDQLTKITNVDFQQQRMLHDRLKELTPVIDKFKRKLTTTQEELTRATQTQKDKLGELKHLQKAKCPYCQQQFEGSAGKISECEHILGESVEAIEKLKAAKQTTSDQLAELNAEKKQIEAGLVVSDFEELLTINSQSNSIKQRVTELENTVNPLLEMLESLENTKLPPIDYTSINQLRKIKEHQEFLVKLLTKKDSFVRKKFLNTNLPFLNSKLLSNLKALGLTHHVEFTHEMTAEITKFDRPVSFGLMSHGQRSRINWALAFAFRDVNQKLHTSVNLCLLDEALDKGLDEPGVGLVSRLIKQKARDEKLHVFIISHKDGLESSFDRTMTIEFDKGFSTIIDRTHEIM